MLSFFYKNQKTCIVLAVLSLVFSFGSIGIFKFLGECDRNGRSDKILFKTGTGRKIKEDYFKVLMNFCNTESTPFSGDPSDWNFLNDGIISDTFLMSALGESLFKKVPLDDSFQTKISKEKNYQFYKRKDAPFVSSEAVWQASAPKLLTALNRLLSQEDPQSVEAFHARVALFIEEKKFPPAFLQRMLQYRQDCYSLPRDQRLFAKPSGFSLFGYNTLSDWFGQNYMKAIAGMLLYGSSEAQNKGIRVTSKEAGILVRLKAREAFDFCCNRIGYKGDFNEFFSNYLNKIGCSEVVLVNIYRDILLFQKYIELMKGHIPFDFRPFKDFSIWSKDNVEIELYHLPEDLVLSDRRDLAGFEAYLDLVTPNRKFPLDINFSFLPVSAVKSRDSRLVGRNYEIEYAVLSIEEIEAGITVQEVRDWQRDPVNKSLLSHEFPELSSCEIAALEKPLKKRVDSFSRHRLIRYNPNLIKSMLREQSSTREKIILSSGQDPVLEGITDGSKLDEILSSGESIEGYSQDNRLFYRFKVLSRDEDESILSYGEVKRRKIFSDLVDKYADKADEILAIIKAHYVTEDALTLRRMVPLIEKYIDNEDKIGPCLGYELVKTRKKIVRSDTFFDAFDNVLQVAGKKSSSIKINSIIGPYYYRVISEPSLNISLDVDKLIFLKEMLADELTTDLFDKLVLDFERKGYLLESPPSAGDAFK